MGQPLVALVAKAPVPGRVKTRCCPPLTAEAAAAVYRGFLIDEVALLAELSGVTPGIILPPDTDEVDLDGINLAGFWIRRQLIAGLSDALGGTVAEGLARGHDRVIIVGSDNPSLPRAIFEQAIAALDSHDVVVGPATDGGYYLIGLARPAPVLFGDMTWSTPTVFAETVDRARRAGLQIACLSPWYDIDTADDLHLLAAHLAADSGIVAPATRQALRAAGIRPELDKSDPPHAIGPGPATPADAALPRGCQSLQLTLHHLPAHLWPPRGRPFTLLGRVPADH